MIVFGRAARVHSLPAAAAARTRPGVSVVLLVQHRLQQRRSRRRQRCAHRLLGHPQRGTGTQHARRQPGQPAYLGGCGLLKPCREPPLCPPGGRDPAPAVAGRAAQIASLTWLTSSTRSANR